MRRIGDHAVVLGASLAGLLAARVLSDAYERVTGGGPRMSSRTSPRIAGVSPRVGTPTRPYSWGRRSSTSSFQGSLDDLAAGGAPVVRDLEELRFSPAGHRLCLEGHPPDLVAYQASRPFLEGHVLARVRALPTVAAR